MELGREYGVADVNLIKPGIGETTRVLLRRMPWRVLLDPRAKGSPAVAHILQLAKERSVPIEWREMENYRACGIIRKLADT